MAGYTLAAPFEGACERAKRRHAFSNFFTVQKTLLQTENLIWSIFDDLMLLDLCVQPHLPLSRFLDELVILAQNGDGLINCSS